MASTTRGGVFLSYRRKDTRHLAGRLYDRLVDRFGANRVFMDVGSIAPGVDFAAAVSSALSSCTVLIVLIGPSWLSSLRDHYTPHRLEAVDDFVVLEVETALRSGIRVLPVLVDGASMPHLRELPPSLSPLARRNAVRVDHDSFRSDVEALLEAIDGILREGGDQPTIVATLRGPSRQKIAGAAVTLIVLAAAIAIGIFISNGRSDHLSATSSTATAPPLPHVVALPDVTGQAQLAAQQTLEAKGFQVQSKDVDGGGDKGTVLSTDPAANTQVQPGSTVTLQVSKGNKDTQVPNVVGQSVGVAQQILNAAGYTNIQAQGVNGSGQPAGTVVDQKPNAGDAADVAVKITLSVETG